MKEMDVCQLLEANPSFASGWKSLQKIADTLLSDRAMSKVIAIKDVESDVARISRWFSKCLRTHLPPTNLKTIRVRLYDPGEYDLVIEGYSARYSARNSGWFKHHCYDPDVRANSRVLEKLMTIGYEQSDLEQYGDERTIRSSICLAYAGLATRHAIQNYTKRAKSKGIAVCAGWDDDEEPVLISHI
jgi:hypothetical protein